MAYAYTTPKDVENALSGRLELSAEDEKRLAEKMWAWSLDPRCDGQLGTGLEMIGRSAFEFGLDDATHECEHCAE